jgi:hypothetical protein
MIPRNQDNIITKTRIQSASPKFSFTFIIPQEFENCRKARAEATTTAALPVGPQERPSFPAVGVLKQSLFF